jgi:predicted AAA+ superfamily ATPase
MSDDGFRLSYAECRALLRKRLAEDAPGRIQLLSGPRQVGKTTLLLELAKERSNSALYAAGDSPEAALPGFWERLWSRAERLALTGRAIVLLDEAHQLHNWAVRLKGEWDRFRRRKTPIHTIASGSAALQLSAGSRESLAGRFEKITLTHWTAKSLAASFNMTPESAAELIVSHGSYPGAIPYLKDSARWSAYVRDAILEPAIGRDILALAPVRKAALLRQVFGVCASSPAQIVSLQKIQGQLQDSGALETIAHYLELLEEAYLVAPLKKYAARSSRRRSAPPSLRHRVFRAVTPTPHDSVLGSKMPASHMPGSAASTSRTGARSPMRWTGSSKVRGAPGPSRSRQERSEPPTYRDCSNSVVATRATDRY